MSIFNWFNKILGIDNSKTKIELPSEFQLPTENVDTNYRNTGYNDHIGQFEKIYNFEDSINIFHTNLEEMLRQFESSNIDNDNSISTVFTFEINGNGGRMHNFNSSFNEEKYNKIPKKNIMAQNYFLNSRLG